MNKTFKPHAARLLASLAVLSIGATEALAIGGGGGTAWTDTSNCTGKPVSGFYVRAGDRVFAGVTPIARYR